MLQHHRQCHTTQDVSILGDDTVFICGHNGCTKRYSELKRLNEHRKQHYRRHRCTVNGCDRAFGRRFDLKEHIKCHHSDDREMEKCSFCTKKFLTKRLLRKHIKMAHDATRMQFACRMCKKRFNRKSALQQHWSTHQDCGGRKTLQCEHCESRGILKTFRQRYNLLKHVRKYHEFRDDL